MISMAYQTELVQNPQDARAVLYQPEATIIVYTWSVALVEDGEPHSVVTHQTIAGCDPQVSITRLEDVVDRVLRQAIIGRPRVECVFAATALGPCGLGKWRHDHKAERQEYRLGCHFDFSDAYLQGLDIPHPYQ